LQRAEDFSITLRLLGLLREGWSGSPCLFNVACGYAVGISHKKLLYRRETRAALERRELLRTIPDYDAFTEILPDRDPTDGRRHFGNNFGCKENRLRNLARTPSSQDEPISTGGADENDTSAGLGVGDRTGADNRYSVPNRASLAGPTGRPGLDRGSPPKKRLSSPAQRAATRHAQTSQSNERLLYFGA
jgi:hypothetical protein